uniref:SWIM-type domain-containing protein n=1 Tax=Lactuca sativa TaxID=4236 RepID=A0A9R1VCC0_LACSA|nr:hypothetical protein LSAT_V11C600322530 [Lactuca sativa]
MFFNGRAVSDVLISNMCEVFNGKIEKGRDKPIIGCLEYIREYLMKRICNLMKEMKKAKGALQGQHVVDVRNKTCTCRKWELIGIPCRHAIATLNEMSKDPEAELDIYQWVHKVYFLETWKKAYSFKCRGVLRVTNKGQVGSQATTSTRKGKELKTQKVTCAVGLDSNNGIYPLAYGIVESENTESWKWFLDNIGDDLDLGRNSNFTFISDKKKGLHTAVEQLFPNAKHRYCIRHIHDNMRKRWRKPEYRDHLWKCALATTIPEFEHLMKEFSQYDKEAY